MSEVSAVEDQALSYNISSGFHSRGTRPENFFHASVLGIDIYFRKKAATWNTMLYKVDYKVTRELRVSTRDGRM